jgi:hypothetical protein
MGKKSNKVLRDAGRKQYSEPDDIAKLRKELITREDSNRSEKKYERSFKSNKRSYNSHRDSSNYSNGSNNTK